MTPSFVHRSINVNGAPFTFYHPTNDDTILGTLSCLQNDRFHLRDVTFAPGDVFVDFGCNVGLLSMLVAWSNPGVRVYAFDASPLAIECVKRGCAANGITNVEAYHLAVGAEYIPNVRFYSNGKEASCLVQEGLNQSNPTEAATVNMVSIDELFDSHVLNLGKVKYLKMDIEGGEFPIFDRLFTHRQDILDRIEYLHLEVHGYQQKGPEELTTKVRLRWGDKVFFDV